MFNSASRSAISFERELCDCSCVIFDGKVRNLRSDAAEEKESGITAEDFSAFRNSLSGSIQNLSKKISISDVKRKKVRKEERKKEHFSSNLKDLLSDTHSQMKVSSKESWINTTPKLASVSTQDQLKVSHQTWERIQVHNPEQREINSARAPELKRNVAFNGLMNGTNSYPIAARPPASRATEIKCVLNSSSGNPVRPVPPVGKSISYQQVRQHQKTFFRPREPLYPAKIHLETIPQVDRPELQPTTSLFSHSNEVMGADYENDRSISNNTMLEDEVQPKLIKPVQAESHYEQTIQRNDCDRSSKGHFSAKFGPMKFKHIVSVPGSEYLEFGEQDSIVIDHFTPVPRGPYILVQNRFSEPPQLPQEEAQYLRTLANGGEVSAFQIEKKNEQSAAKTQRPTVAHNDE